MNNNKNRLKLISIISPCFNEEKNVLECYNSVKDVFIRYLPHYEYEHIFSDNNSKDSTQKILKELAIKDKRVFIFFGCDHCITKYQWLDRQNIELFWIFF